MRMVRSIIRKVVRGDSIRKTRFHTSSGKFTPTKNLIGFFPSATSWLIYRITGKRNLLPWWTWDAIQFVAGKLDSNDRTLEVGSGMSTIWLAKRCEHVDAIEQNTAWADEVKNIAVKLGVDNVSLHHGDEMTLISKLMESEQAPSEVAVVDGSSDRLNIFKLILNKRPLFRIIIFDDTDRLEYRDAFLWASEKGYKAYQFSGFKPQTLHACETTVFLLSSK